MSAWGDSDTSSTSGTSTETEEFGLSDAARRQRLEWHSMLASVVQGDIFDTERGRVNAANQVDAAAQGTPTMIWFGIRARLHGRTVADEIRATHERRARVGTKAVNAIIRFRVSDGATGASDLVSALLEVQSVINGLQEAMACYPHTRYFHEDQPEARTPAFSSRVDALHAWSTLVVTLRQQMTYLRAWVEEVQADRLWPPPPQHVRANPKASLVESMLKDDTVVRMFEHRFLFVVASIAERARNAQVAMDDLYQEMNLPSLAISIAPLVSFPFDLMQSFLHSQAENVTRLRNPTAPILDELTLQLRRTIGLACALKSRFDMICAPAVGSCWSVQRRIPQEFTTNILEATRALFRLLEWKLHLASHDRFFQEVDVLDSQLDLAEDVNRTIRDHSFLIAEELGALTSYALRVGTTNLKKACQQILTAPTQLAASDPLTCATSPAEAEGRRQRNTTITVGHQLLETLRVRYWKVLRFVSYLTRTFGHCVDWKVQEGQQHRFLQFLSESGHFLIDTTSQKGFEGILIIASPWLVGREDQAGTFLETSFLALRGHDFGHVGADDFGDHPGYLLLWRPGDQITWSGTTVAVSMPSFDVDLGQDQVRLVTTGPGTQLHAACNDFLHELSAGTYIRQSRSITGLLWFVGEDRAPSRVVNRQLQAVLLAKSDLVQTIMEAAVLLARALREWEGSHSLVGEFFARSAKHHELARTVVFTPAATADFIVSWMTFIVEYADMESRRTMEWAVKALDFTKRQSAAIARLSPDKYTTLQQSVSTCMSLIVTHYDVGSVKKDQREGEKRRQFSSFIAGLRLRPTTPSPEGELPSGKQARTLLALDQIELARSKIAQNLKYQGRVLDQEAPDDNPLVLLASATSNISMRWRKGMHLGTGASGSVHVAVDLESGSVMAVKEIQFRHTSLLGVSNLQRQFKRELDVMEMLRHPNIVNYYGIEVHRDKVYIFEEYCPGGSLEDLVAHGPIEEQICQIYALQMLEGLTYLHSNNVTHRDIKPANILLDSSGSLKFADFGAATVLKGAQTMDESLTPRASVVQGTHRGTTGQAGANIAGTPMYMAPEVIKSQAESGTFGAMDIWGVGCVLLRCLTGRQPWPGLENEWSIMFHIAVTEEPPPLPEPSICSDSGITLLRACLMIKAASRPSAQDLLRYDWMQECQAMLYEHSLHDIG